jgi:hypothetical protein
MLRAQALGDVTSDLQPAGRHCLRQQLDAGAAVTEITETAARRLSTRDWASGKRACREEGLLMSDRIRTRLMLAVSVAVVAFLWSEFTLNFNLHWFTVADGVFGKFGLPQKFQLVLPASFITWGLYYMLGADAKGLRTTLVASTTGTLGAVVVMTLGPALAGLPSLWGVSLAIALVGGGLVVLSALTDDGSLAAAPAFACAAAVLFWWFATGLDNYVTGGAGPHTVAALGLALTKHPLAAGTGALGGLLSTPWTWVAISCWVSLVIGPVLGVISRALAAAPGRLSASWSRSVSRGATA